MMYPRVDEIERFDPDDVVAKLHRILDGLVSGQIPGQGFTSEKLELFLVSLIENQRGPGQFIFWGGSWSLISTDEPAPSDIRVSYVFFPSYLVVSILSFCRFAFEDLALSIGGYEDALMDGLHFISARQFNGHGIDGEYERRETVRILLKGKVERLITNNSSHCEKCETLYRSLISMKRTLISYDNHTLVDNSILKGLQDIPAFIWNSDNSLSWTRGERENVRLEFCTGNELSTRSFDLVYLEKISLKTRCSIVIHKHKHCHLECHSGEKCACHHNEKYQAVLTGIQPCKPLVDNQPQNLVLVGSRSVDQLGGADIKVSGNFNCDNDLLNSIAWNFKISMEGFSRREYRVSSIGQDKEHPCFRTLERLYGTPLICVEVLLSKTLFIVEPDRIADSLVILVDRFFE